MVTFTHTNHDTEGYTLNIGRISIRRSHPTFTPAQEAYIARFAQLSMNITYWCSRDKDDTRERRNLHRLWEIADNQPLAIMADRLFEILRAHHA